MELVIQNELIQYLYGTWFQQSQLFAVQERQDRQERGTREIGDKRADLTIRCKTPGFEMRRFRLGRGFSAAGVGFLVNLA